MSESDEELSEYEKQRLKNIQNNQRILQELGLDTPLLKSCDRQKKKNRTTKSIHRTNNRMLRGKGEPEFALIPNIDELEDQLEDKLENPRPKRWKRKCDELHNPRPKRKCTEDVNYMIDFDLETDANIAKKKKNAALQPNKALQSKKNADFKSTQKQLNAETILKMKEEEQRLFQDTKPNCGEYFSEDTMKRLYKYGFTYKGIEDYYGKSRADQFLKFTNADPDAIQKFTISKQKLSYESLNNQLPRIVCPGGCCQSFYISMNGTIRKHMPCGLISLC